MLDFKPVTYTGFVGNTIASNFVAKLAYFSFTV